MAFCTVLHQKKCSLGCNFRFLRGWSRIGSRSASALPVCDPLLPPGRGGYVLLPFRRSVAEGPTVLSGNSSFVLAAERTQRRDPLNGFKDYTGGWNISNRHYWAHFEASEVAVLTCCLCLPLVSVRVGKINKQGNVSKLPQGKKKLLILISRDWIYTHVMTVKAGEDVSSKIMSLSQNGPHTNGPISSLTLRQAATSDRTITYEISLRLRLEKPVGASFLYCSAFFKPRICLGMKILSALQPSSQNALQVQ